MEKYAIGDLTVLISEWIKNQVSQAGKKGIVLGLSGGIDSACVAVLSKKAVGNNVLGVLLPCGSGLQDKSHALLLAEKFNIKTRIIPLDEVFNVLVEVYPDSSSIARANLKPRLRMLMLYYIANSLDYLVAGTGNRSELSVGYFTKYGDGGVDMLPLGGLLKTEVRKLAEELGIHQEIIAKPPSAGLWHNQTDEVEMGITYEDLDKILTAIEEGTTALMDQDKLLRVENMMKNSKHKRVPLPVFNK